MNDEDIISVSAFARKLDVDEKLIRRGIANGKLNDGVITVKGKSKIILGVALVEAKKAGIGLRLSANKIDKPQKKQIVSKPETVKQPSEPKNEITSIEDLEINDNFNPDQKLSSYADALKKKENYIAGIKKLEFLEKRKTLVNKTEVYSQLFDFGKEIRSEFESLPGKIGAKLAACGGDSSKISETLANEIRNSLSKLIDNLANKPLTK
jgi:hypothetical protein